VSQKEKASAFRRWQATRAYSPHPEPPVLRVEAIISQQISGSRSRSFVFSAYGRIYKRAVWNLPKRVVSIFDLRQSKVVEGLKNE